MTNYHIKCPRIEGILSSGLETYLGQDGDYYFLTNEEGETLWGARKSKTWFSADVVANCKIEFTSEDITKMPTPIQTAIGKGVLVLEEVE